MERNWHDKEYKDAKREEWLLLLSVFHAGRSMLCAGAEVHRRGMVHRMERRHRA
jgi:hypothetical protein